MSEVSLGKPQLSFPLIVQAHELGLTRTLEFRSPFPFGTCVVLILQVGHISVFFIDDQELTGSGCPCFDNIHLYVIFNWLQSTVNQ